jgi:hypothetical protein
MQPPSAGYNPAEEDEEGLYALEPDDPDDIYNDGEEVGFSLLSKCVLRLLGLLSCQTSWFLLH